LDVSDHIVDIGDTTYTHLGEILNISIFAVHWK
jgi:hypothetical protein